MKLYNTAIQIIISSLVWCMVWSHTWDYDVYVGRQFDDLVTATTVASPQIIRPGLLVLFTPSCATQVTTDLGLSDRPPNQYLVYALHDYVTYPENVWYEIDERDDLKARYQPQACPEYLFFRKGATLETPVRYYRGGGESAKTWLWRQLTVIFELKNSLLTDITLEYLGNGPKLATVTVPSGDYFWVEAYVSYCVRARRIDTDQFVWGKRLDEDTAPDKLVEIKEGMFVAEDPNVWYGKIQKDMDRDSYKSRDRQWQIAQFYLMCLKQPLLLPRFTDVGYKIGKMPEDVYKSLLHFYKSNLNKRQPEANEVEPVINDSEVKCGFVPFDDDTTQFVAKHMKPLMEEWSNTSLTLSRLYGIREYYTGNILRNHVDIITTHVISVILQIDQELGGQPEWELEVIGYDGKRKNVTMVSGDMMFYESAVLVHGRPYPFKGKIFANAFLHYRPSSNWGWNEGHGGKFVNGDFAENLEVFPSPLTMNRGKKGLIRDEL